MATAKQTGAILTLIRGRKYTMVHPFDRRAGAYQFEKGVPRAVKDPAVVEYARQLTDTVVDGDGSEMQKPMFRITPLEAEKGSTARRAVPVERDEDEAPARRPGIRSRRKL